MVPDGSPLDVLAQQGAEVVNLIVAEKSVDDPRKELSGDHNERVRHHRRSEAPQGQNVKSTMTISSKRHHPNREERILRFGGTTQRSPVASQVQGDSY
jgi:hypothetical protein